METEESYSNSIVSSSQVDNSVDITPFKLVSTDDDFESSSLPPVVEPKLENKKRNKSFQKKNREQMRSRIKNSLFSNSKNASVACSMDNLVENLQQNQLQAAQGEHSNSLNSITPSLVLSSEQSIPLNEAPSSNNNCNSNQNNNAAATNTITAATPQKAEQPNAELSSFSSQKRQVFLRLQSLEDHDQIEKERKQGIFKISGNFADYYELQETLGEGCVGLVKKGVRKSDGLVFAVKTVRTRDEETIQNIKSEFMHLKQLNHPNIVKVYELYIDNLTGKIHSVMELIQGKEMFEVIHELGHYSELVASRIFSQILDAIAYMHQNYCCHRDLKPNNILCNNDGTDVKITDFNVSKFSDHYKNYQGEESIIHQSIKMWTYTGTMAFSAPEVFNGDSYDETIDMWSAGCILFTMLSGREPFQAEYVNDLVQLICQGKYNFDDAAWNDISSEAKDLISKCLTVDSTIRIKPEEALLHPFIMRARVNSSLSQSAIECASPVRIPLIEGLSQNQPSIECDEDKNNEAGTPQNNVNLCRKQLSNNIDRLIVNNSKKNKNLSIFSRNDRPRAVSSICILDHKNSNALQNLRNQLNGIKQTGMTHQEEDSDNDQKDDDDDILNQEEEANLECSSRKKKRKFTIIFSKEDCFSNHVDTDSSSHNLNSSRGGQKKFNNNKDKNTILEVRESLTRFSEFEQIITRDRSKFSSKKRESNLSGTLNMLEDSSQQQLDNQNMTTSSSSSSSLSSSPSPKIHHHNLLASNNIASNFSNTSRTRNSKQKENLYWNDEESENYSVSDFITETPKDNNQSKKQNGNKISIIKNVFNSFKNRLVFSNQRNNLNSATQQRSFSCDIQNNEEYLELQNSNGNSLLKEMSFLKNKDNNNSNNNNNTFQNGIEALTRLCAPAFNRLIGTAGNKCNQSTQNTCNSENSMENAIKPNQNSMIEIGVKQ